MLSLALPLPPYLHRDPKGPARNNWAFGRQLEAEERAAQVPPRQGLGQTPCCRCGALCFLPSQVLVWFLLLLFVAAAGAVEGDACSIGSNSKARVAAAAVEMCVMLWCYSFNQRRSVYQTSCAKSYGMLLSSRKALEAPSFAAPLL